MVVEIAWVASRMAGTPGRRHELRFECPSPLQLMALGILGWRVVGRTGSSPFPKVDRPLITQIRCGERSTSSAISGGMPIRIGYP